MKLKLELRARSAAIAAVSVALLLLPFHTASAQTSGANLLDNPNFSWPAQTNSNICAPGMAKDNAITPRAWTAFWTCKNDAEKNQDQINRDPEFRLMNADVSEQQPRVRSYPTSASFFNFYSLQRSAGVLQNVRNIRPGTRLRFNVWVQLWSTNADAANSSYQPGGMQARACIDTIGMTIGTPNYASPSIVCGAPTRQYDQFVQITVDATAASDQVTVIVDSSSDFPVKHNDVFIDDAELFIIDGSAPVAPAPAPAAAPAAAPAVSGVAPAVSVQLPQINVREKPSYNAPILAQATQGQSFPATAVTTDKQWFQIQFNGRTAYVHSSVVTPNAAAAAAMNGASAAPTAPAPAPTAVPAAPAAAAPAPAAPAPVSVDTLPVIAAAPASSTEAAAIANTGASKLLVRQSPSAKSKVVAKVASGTRFIVLGVSPDKVFWRVRYDGVAGGEAWIMVRWTTANEYAQVMLR